MRLHVIAAGRIKGAPQEMLVRYYAERIAWPLTIREVEEKRPLSAGEIKEREAALLLAASPPRATLVALDARGQALTSEAFAERLQRWRDGGIGDLAFLIGGAEGLGDAVRRKAHFLLSLGAMTWPHLLARAMLLEQIYRAQQILAGHPYHRA
jgi:23S rRNA (pseudouridine1915-N3)-methyltransferase